jgi:hypothetical protein
MTIEIHKHPFSLDIDYSTVNVFRPSYIADFKINVWLNLAYRIICRYMYVVTLIGEIISVQRQNQRR